MGYSPPCFDMCYTFVLMSLTVFLSFPSAFSFSRYTFSQEWPLAPPPTLHPSSWQKNLLPKGLPMASLKVISYNVRGLCSPCKHSKLWWELKQSGANVVLLQETHFTPPSMPKLPTHLYNQWYLSNSPVVKSRGTAIAVHKSCPFQVTESKEGPRECTSS